MTAQGGVFSPAFSATTPSTQLQTACDIVTVSISGFACSGCTTSINGLLIAMHHMAHATAGIITTKEAFAIPQTQGFELELAYQSTSLLYEVTFVTGMAVDLWRST